jgi:polysaccharide export outer membrane protein
MTSFIRFFLLAAALFVRPSAFAADNAPPADPNAYTIGPGDILEIGVWKDESLSKLVPVLPDGSIAFPLLGNVTAAGKTVEQLKEELKEKLVKYIPDPILHVGVQQVNSMLVYIIGRVNGPGRQALNSHATVLQVLASAGGLNPFADSKKIMIMRGGPEGTKILMFNYDEVSAGKNLEQNITLQRGDVIVVP